MAARILLAVLAIAMLPAAAALAGPQIVQLSPDTYMIVRDSKAGMFTSMAKLKTETIASANEFASSQGKVAIAISSKEKRAIPFANPWPSFEYQFRLVEPGDAAAAATELTTPTRDGASTATDAMPAATTTEAAPGATRDIYVELTRLDELRQKGIITQDEFDEQKRKILASN